MPWLPNLVEEESLPPSPKESQVQDLDSIRGIHQQLDELSAKMDACLTELSVIRAERQVPKGAGLVPEAAFTGVIPQAALPLSSRTSVDSTHISRAPALGRNHRGSLASTGNHGRGSLASTGNHGRGSLASTVKSVASKSQAARHSMTSVVSHAQMTSATTVSDVAARELLQFNEVGAPEQVSVEELGHRLEVRRRNGVTRKSRFTDLSEQIAKRSLSDICWDMLDDTHSSPGALVISMILRAIVICSLVLTCAQIQEESFARTDVALALEMGIDAIFLLECTCRFITAPSRYSYIQDFYNWPEIAAAFGLPCRLLRLVVPEQAVLDVLLLSVLPIPRFLKLMRYFESLRLLLDAAANCLACLPVLLYTMILIVLVAANTVYLVEPRESIPSLAHATWLSVVTMATVGYGDYVPRSAAGCVVIGMLMMVSLLFFALPVGIIGYEFTVSWQHRHQVLLLWRVRKAFVKWGYSGHAVQSLFNQADEDGDGSLNLVEFCELLAHMKLGLDSAEVVQLFQMLDDRQDGAIKIYDFVRRLFPGLLFNEEMDEPVQPTVSRGRTTLLQAVPDHDVDVEEQM